LKIKSQNPTLIKSPSNTPTDRRKKKKKKKGEKIEENQWYK